jgi:hypothetical protein
MPVPIHRHRYAVAVPEYLMQEKHNDMNAEASSLDRLHVTRDLPHPLISSSSLITTSLTDSSYSFRHQLLHQGSNSNSSDRSALFVR